MSPPAHEYSAYLVWNGNTGQGTSSYASYRRTWQALIPGKPGLTGSADPVFRGEANLPNPEDLFLSAVAACHMLVYLALCARRGVQVIAYADDARATLVTDERGGGRFQGVTLRPSVTVASAEQAALAMQLHDAAHDLCFIANSCSVAIGHQPTVDVAEPGLAAPAHQNGRQRLP